MSSNFNPMLLLATKVARCLSFALLPALASEANAGAASSQQIRSAAVTRHRTSVPYLALIGSTGLRTEAVAITLQPEPKSPEPPKPPQPVVEEKPKVVEPKPEVRVEPPRPVVVQVAPEPAEEPPPQVDRSKRPVSILPDDTVRELNPDEVLPYFRYPGSVNEPQRVPTPETMPRSSATYRVQ